jgi:flagellar protein FliO/FliZ
MDYVGQALRLVLSLGVVLALMWLAARMLRGRAVRGGGDVVTVLGRVQLARGASVTVVKVADRALIVGVTEQRIALLSEAPAAAVEPAGAAGEAPRGAVGNAGTVVAPPAGANSSMTVSARAHAVPAASPDHARATASGRGRARPGGPLAGSVLSPRTWKLAVEILRERTVRRG